MKPSDLTHHPECFYWFENHDPDCSCSLTAPAMDNGLRPWSQADLDAYRQRIGCSVNREPTP